ncbi:TRAP transporter large permease subunit [Leptolyngbya sp. 15MV]|nr:TRAP transporter large permease subunit [Leptolyngbya sp. 15MV]
MSTIGLTVLGILALSLAAGVWVAVTLLLVGVSALEIFRAMPVPRILAQSLFNNGTAPELLALPLFILMAEILFRTRMSEQLLRGFSPWTWWLPGRLLHVNVLASAVFAAVCGSSAATTATIGRITYAELNRRGYDRGAAIGSLAGAGTLGLLIPPSTVMIIYGVLSDTSILKLFIGGIVPGIMLAAFLMAAIVIWALLRPGIVPAGEVAPGWGERLGALPELLPPLALIATIMGSMYFGIATPTEAAAVGVFAALALSSWYRSLDFRSLSAALMAAVRTSSMIGLIALAAAFVSVAMGYLGLPRWVAGNVAAWGLSKYELIAVLVVLYLILGCFLEGLAIIVLTLPVVLPLVQAAGFDKLWFGIFLTIMIETAQITPPVGFNLFVLNGLTREPIGRIAVAAIPSLMALVTVATLITIFPGLATWLPGTIGG